MPDANKKPPSSFKKLFLTTSLSSFFVLPEIKGKTKKDADAYISAIS